MQTYTLKVVAVVQETSDAVTLSFKQPALKKIRYRAGQYITLVFRINGRRYIRPYSFSSAPSVNATLDITIKRVPNGVVSNHIIDMVEVGDSIEVIPPMGDFIFDCEEDCNCLFLWGVGSGITPLMSIAKEVLHQDDKVKVNLIYGNRSASSTIFYQVINELENKYGERFNVFYFYTQEINQVSNQQFVGRIEPRLVLNNYSSIELTTSRHFICGPQDLKQSVLEVLVNEGVSKKGIYFEQFELVKNPLDFANIHTQNVTVKFMNEESIIEVVKGKSILETALDSGIELPYSCQTGNCSMCKGKLVSGQARMIGLTEQRSDLGNNEFLLCCTHPLNDNVYIEL